MLRRGGACSSRCKMSDFYVCCFLITIFTVENGRSKPLPYQIASNVVAFLIDLRPCKLRYNEVKYPFLPIIVYKNAENPTTVVSYRDFSMFGFCVFSLWFFWCFMFLFSLFQARIYGIKGGRVPLASVPILSSFLTPCECRCSMTLGFLPLIPILFKTAMKVTPWAA